MERTQLTTKKRELTGKKIKTLRNQGILPVNIHGADTESISLQMDLKDFVRATKNLGESDLIDLLIEGENKPRPVLISEIQQEPVNATPIHVDFLQVNLTEEVEVSVPLEFVGESPVVKDKLGILLTLIDELPIKALPTDLPSTIEVDISGLTSVGDHITVEQLTIPDKVSVMVDDPEEFVVKIEGLSKSLEEEEPEEKEVAEGEEVEVGTEAASGEREELEESEE